MFLSCQVHTHSTSQIISSGAKKREESAASATSLENKDLPSRSVDVKRGCKEVRGKESRKRKGEKSDEANSTDDLSSFKEIWEKRLQQENDRFDKSKNLPRESKDAIGTNSVSFNRI